MSASDTTKDIMDALKEKHSTECWVEELPFTNATRRIDLFVIAPTAGKGYITTAYEVKASKADFKRDSHIKQREARLYSEFFYYVTPEDLVDETDIPDWAGWMVQKPNGRFKTIIPAPRTSRLAPSWELVVSMLRYAQSSHRDVSHTHAMALKQKNLLAKKLGEWNKAFGYGEPEKIRKQYTRKEMT